MAPERAGPQRELGGAWPAAAGRLGEQLRIRPEDGRIWLADQRMIMMHSHWYGALRREFIEAVGLTEARGMLTRMGFRAGAHDAALGRKLATGGLRDLLRIGPELHALQGLVQVEDVRIELQPERGHIYLEQLWHGSAEADAHLTNLGPSVEPVCWMQIGYASGYVSSCVGRTIIFHEVECRACGDAACRIIGRPAEQWPEGGDLRFLRPNAFMNPEGPPRSPAQVHGIIGASGALVAACMQLEHVARTDATTIFLGETGVGKERFARALHQLSRRSKGPFVAVNCAAVPENLLEAELFGTTSGAFTGARNSPGRFERASGGTLFLDEVGTLGLPAQSKLLRVIQEREVERVGSGKPIPVDIRLVCATNIDLPEEVRARRFRADLYYRLNVVPIQIPPLRERRDDIPLLIEHFLGRTASQHGRRISGITERAATALLDYDYPGNVRELENMIERAVVLTADDSPIDTVHLFSPDQRAARIRSSSGTLELLGGNLPVYGGVENVEDLMQIEHDLIKRAMATAGGNVSQAAKRLRMTRAQLDYRLRKLQGSADLHGEG